MPDIDIPYLILALFKPRLAFARHRFIACNKHMDPYVSLFVFLASTNVNFAESIQWVGGEKVGSEVEAISNRGHRETP